MRLMIPAVLALFIASILGIDPAWAEASAGEVPLNRLFGIPIDFLIFAATLGGVALLHHRTLQVALTGLATIILYKLVFSGFKTGLGFSGLVGHFGHEWVLLANLFLLLTGFGLLSRHFEESRLPDEMPAILPDDWKGCFVLLVLIWVLSGFLDNIAAAIIGTTVATKVFHDKVHIGYLAAIVAASNAGGAGSVLGDTTTTMMWIDGVSPLDVLHAYIAAFAALLVFGIPASLKQQRYSPVMKHIEGAFTIDYARVTVVGLILVAAVATNITTNIFAPELAEMLPVLGISVWAVLLLASGWRRPDWSIMPETAKGSIFLLALVASASMMPVEELPSASWQTALGLGFVSSVFDNIPLTALALKQGGYDWGLLAFAVGFGGSMVWFGSSAGVAVSNLRPEARSVGLWVRHGWPVVIGYIVGFFVLLLLLGWHPVHR
ncbi:MAG: citrate transporter [Hyphomicrobiaceae bacterium]